MAGLQPAVAGLTLRVERWGKGSGVEVSTCRAALRASVRLTGISEAQLPVRNVWLWARRGSSTRTIPSIDWEQSEKSGLHVNTGIDLECVASGARSGPLPAGPLLIAKDLHSLVFCRLTEISRFIFIYLAYSLIFLLCFTHFIKSGKMSATLSLKTASNTFSHFLEHLFCVCGWHSPSMIHFS